MSTKSTPQIWYLFNKTYDLTPFLDQHPGGKQILYTTVNHCADITPMFMQSHALADVVSIKKRLEKYEVKGVRPLPQLYTYKEDGFYRTLVRRVKTHLNPNQDINKSFCKFGKSTYLFWLKILLLIFLLGWLHLNTFWVSEHSLWHYPQAYICGILSMSLLFHIVHDGNHFECFAAPYSWANETISRIVSANTWVKHEMIMTHHTFRHHAYTGNPVLDPERQWLVKQWIKNLFRKPLHGQIFIICLFGFLPGQWVLTGLVYLRWYQTGRLMNKANQKLPVNITFQWYEIVIYAYNIIMQIYSRRFLVSWLYFIGLSNLATLGFSITHDNIEVLEMGDVDPNKDFGEVQCYNNSNFHNGVWYDFMHELLSGLSYHYEHHLFPTLSHSHYQGIAPIVKKTCEEFNLPYLHFDSFYTVVSQVLEKFGRLTDRSGSFSKVEDPGIGNFTYQVDDGTYFRKKDYVYEKFDY